MPATEREYQTAKRMNKGWRFAELLIKIIIRRPPRICVSCRLLFLERSDQGAPFNGSKWGVVWVGGEGSRQVKSQAYSGRWWRSAGVQAVLRLGVVWVRYMLAAGSR